MLMEFLDFDGSGFVEAQELIDFLEDQVHRGPVPGPASMAVLHAIPRRDVPRLALTLSWWWRRVACRACPSTSTPRRLR